jgi:hypothetical protein
MSAFLCNPNHIGRLAAFLAEQSRDTTSQYQDPAHIAEVLARANINSVGYRYGDLDNPDKVVSVFGYDGDAQTFVDSCVVIAVSGPSQLSAVDAYKMARCSDYQSCELPDWTGSAAWRVLQAVQYYAAIAGFGVDAYEAAMWEYEAKK